MQALTLRAGKRQLVLILFALAISAVALGVVGTRSRRTLHRTEKRRL